MPSENAVVVLEHGDMELERTEENFATMEGMQSESAQTGGGEKNKMAEERKNFTALKNLSVGMHANVLRP